MSGNGIVMSLADHTDEIAGTINDNGKQVHDVAAQHIDVESIGIRKTGKIALNVTLPPPATANRICVAIETVATAPPTPPSWVEANR